MDPKPLTKERRAGIEETRDEYAAEGRALAKDYDDLLAAERFWREAVKNAEEFPSDECPFCLTRNDGLKHSRHKPDCPRLLAQE